MFRAALIVMMFFVLSRFTGILREVILSDRFGTSAAVRCLSRRLSCPRSALSVGRRRRLGQRFLYRSFRASGSRTTSRDAWLLFSRVLNLVTLRSCRARCAGSALLTLDRALLSWRLASAPEQQALTATLMRGMLLGTVIFGASGLVMGALNATQHFVAPAAAPVRLQPGDHPCRLLSCSRLWHLWPRRWRGCWFAGTFPRAVACCWCTRERVTASACPRRTRPCARC